MIKRIFDLIFSIFGLILLSPLFFTVIILIKIEDNGPVFYRGERIGRSGKSFRIFKFRTMVVNADKIGGSSTPQDDPRITATGRFLRKFKIDEFSQLINVLLGDMSLVGPRPQVPWAVKLYSGEEKDVLLKIKPGITDPASIKFHNEDQILRGSSDPDRDYMEKIHPEKMRLSMEYARNMSLSRDIRTVLDTFLTVIRRRS